MRIGLGARVRTRDGEDAGTVHGAVLDPRTNEVTDFVVGTAGLLGRDVLVPRAEVEGASPVGDAVRLELTRDELSRLPVYVPAAYRPPPEGWPLPADSAFPDAGFLWPATAPFVPPVPPPATPEAPVGGAPGAPAPGADERDETDGGVALSAGSLVVDRDGEDLGMVEDVVFDPESGALRAFVLRTGGVLRTLFGGGERLDVSASLVARVGEGVVYLKVPKGALTPLLR